MIRMEAGATTAKETHQLSPWGPYLPWRLFQKNIPISVDMCSTIYVYCVAANLHTDCLAKLSERDVNESKS